MPEKVITLDGRQALVSNVSAHGADVQGFSVFRDVITDVKRRIMKRPGFGAAQGGAAGASVLAMHEYIHTNTTTGAKTYWLFRATATIIQYWTGAAWSTMSLPISLTAGSLPWFENVENRCLFVNGKDQSLIFNGTDWEITGCEGPASAMGYSLGHLDKDGNIAAGTYTVATVSVTNGSDQVIGAIGTRWPTGVVWSSPYMDIDGVRYQVSTIDAQGDGATTTSSLTLTEGYKGTTGAGKSYVIYSGMCEWDLPPRYAYAYYNPTTGHCSNIRSSALTTENITEITETDQVGRTITLTNIVYSPDAYNAGFTRIKIFRTPKNGNILVALSTDIANSNGAGSTTFSESAATFVDSALTKFPAQRTKLRVPPTALAAVKYHLGRVFGVKHNRLYFSLHESEVTGELGVPEESWPSNYSRAVNSANALVAIGATGGSDNLIIQTAFGNSSVDGFDHRDMFAYPLPTPENASLPYSAIGTHGSLISFYNDKNLIEWPGNTDLGEPIQDKLDLVKDSLLSSVRLHRFRWQSRDFLTLSVPKNSSSTTTDATYVLDVKRGGWYDWNGGFTAFATAHDSSTGALQLWASNSSGNSYRLLQAGQWQDAGSNFAPTLTSHVIRPFEEFKAVLKQVIIYVNDAQLVASGPTTLWTGEWLINEQAAAAGQAFTFNVERHQKQTAQGRKLTWTPPITTRVEAAAHQFSITWPTANAELYIEKIVLIFEQGERIDVSEYST
jgi:hypothetical protein